MAGRLCHRLNRVFRAFSHSYPPQFKHGRIIFKRWHRRRYRALHRLLALAHDELSLIRLYYSTAGGGGPPRQVLLPRPIRFAMPRPW